MRVGQIIRRKSNTVRGRFRNITQVLAIVGLAASLPTMTGCATQAENIALGVVGTTVIGARSASSEIEQTYYVGVFDPQAQLPPQVYRLRVHGQASFLGFTKFASGWVPAALADSLGSNISNFDKNASSLQITPAADAQLAKIQTGRRLVMFGPEGFREAPADQRLVIVMGSNPNGYFQAIDSALGSIGQANLSKQNAKLTSVLFDDLVQVKNERERLDDLSKDINNDIPADATTTK
jgi:hypothetical protein